jgi:hypothetical protein
MENKAMTLILALKWIIEGKEGVVVSSDSKATVGPVSYEVRKVYPIVLEAEGNMFHWLLLEAPVRLLLLSRVIGFARGF